MMRERTQVHVNALFGSTSIAGGVPDGGDAAGDLRADEDGGEPGCQPGTGDDAGSPDGNGEPGCQPGGLPGNGEPGGQPGTGDEGALPGMLSPAAGPVYLEGRLVLSLSFKVLGEQASWLSALAGRMGDLELPSIRRGKPLERYRVWDDLAGDWLGGSPTVLRFENADVVECGDGEQMPVWTGAVDVRRRVIAVPDLDRAGIAANRLHDLRWKLCDA